MVNIEIKDGVRFHTGGHAAALSHMTIIVAQVFEEYGTPYCEITGGVEEHRHRSLHVHGDALDYGSRGFFDETPKEERDAMLRMIAGVIATRLGDGYDFFWEPDTGSGEHFHGEYQPKDWRRLR